MQKRIFEIEVGGKLLTAEFNDLAPQTNGSVMLRYGETVVLVTVCLGASPATLPYLPLSVEFEEKFYEVIRTKCGIRIRARSRQRFDRADEPPKRKKATR